MMSPARSPAASANDASTDATLSTPSTKAPRRVELGLGAEIGIALAFLVVCAVGIATVVWPEGSAGDSDARAVSDSASAGAPADAPTDADTRVQPAPGS